MLSGMILHLSNRLRIGFSGNTENPSLRSFQPLSPASLYRCDHRNNSSVNRTRKLAVPKGLEFSRASICKCWPAAVAWKWFCHMRSIHYLLCRSAVLQWKWPHSSMYRDWGISFCSIGESGRQFNHITEQPLNVSHRQAVWVTLVTGGVFNTERDVLWR